MQFTTNRIYPIAASFRKADGFTSGSLSFSFTSGDVVNFNCFTGDVVYVEKPGVLTASSPVYDMGPFYYTIIGQNEASNTNISITLNFDRDICASYVGTLGEKVWFRAKP